MKITVAALTIIVAAGTASAGPSAEQLFSEGEQAIKRGDYATAIARYQSSYELSKLPLLVLNIAQAYRLAGDCAQALSAYRQYVTLDSASEGDKNDFERNKQRSLADGFITELEPKCGALSPAAVEEHPSPVESTRSGRNLKLAGLVTGGAGAALVATGLLFGRRASTLGDEVTAACAPGCDWKDLKDKDAIGRRYATIGYTLDVLGLAAIAGGATIYYFGNREGTVAVSRGRDGGARVTWSGSW